MGRGFDALTCSARSEDRDSGSSRSRFQVPTLRSSPELRFCPFQPAVTATSAFDSGHRQDANPSVQLAYQPDLNVWCCSRHFARLLLGELTQTTGPLK